MDNTQYHHKEKPNKIYNKWNVDPPAALHIQRRRELHGSRVLAISKWTPQDPQSGLPK